MDLIRRKKTCKYPKCETAYYTNCTTNKHLYKFPIKPELYDRWKRNLKIDPNVNCHNWVICEDHFRLEDFVNTTKHRLNHNVVPIEYNNNVDNIKRINHDHSYFNGTNTNESDITPLLQDNELTLNNPLVNRDDNYIRIAGSDLNNIESISIPNVSLPSPVLIQTKQNNDDSNCPNTATINVGVKQIILNNLSVQQYSINTKTVNSIGTNCNLNSPKFQEQLIKSVENERKLRSKLRSLQQRYNKTCRNLRELRTMFRKEDLIGLIEQRRFKSMESLTDICRMFIVSQLRNASKTPYGRRYTRQELEFFTELYRKGPAIYRYLDQFLILPSKRTIKLVMNKQLDHNKHNMIDIDCKESELENFLNCGELKQ